VATGNSSTGIGSRRVESFDKMAMANQGAPSIATPLIHASNFSLLRWLRQPFPAILRAPTDKEQTALLRIFFGCPVYD
jgi:hypothetical protein